MMSTKSAVTSLRSPSGTKPNSAAWPTAISDGRGSGPGAVSAEPHWLQKREPARLGCPQLRHVTGNATPHELQNLAVSGLSASQFEHRMVRISWRLPVTARITLFQRKVLRH